ncbi:DUF5979 domain-containing protein [Microbacterium sp. SORGH_AS_0888]|uniref:DUF7507 domain-containing protein n=1 Tax=Microbacterium sp. SORGH_AS_0888 TaxID=3041791 RepID=UPI002781FF23|nr:DUF5979 domain-containing protein [Microbacterium sp. SORGH_AS_0888]MDQ1131224.1 hypothetical protein [Microbacterium sp. SORGH_AS_0888]
MVDTSVWEGRRLRRRILGLAVVAGLAAAAALAGPIAASAAPVSGGSLLSDETFSGATVPDARWIGLGDSCLTAATPGSAPPAGVSNLSGCSKVQDSVTNMGSGSDGYLQLTDNSGSASAATVLDRAFPSSAGLEMTFDQYQYASSGTGFGPADGIGFFLTDGAYTLTQAGPSGGSLGYASINSDAGIPHGYLGLGFDVFGNYENQPYVGTSCPAQNSSSPSSPSTANSVGLRGPGDGTDGYCLIASAPYASLQNAPASAPGGARGTPQRVTVTVSPTTPSDPYPTVTASINGVQVLQATMTTPVPATLKLGFAASTGSGHEVHMIRNVAVSSIDPLGSIDLTKTVDHSDATGTSQTVFTEGDEVPYSFLVTNTGAEALSNVTVTDPKISSISCPATTLQPANSFTCTGTYGPLTASDVASGTFTNTATATGVDTDNTTHTSTSTADVATYRSAPLEIDKRLTGTAASAVDPSTSFTVDYSYPAGAYVPAPSAASGAPSTYPAGSGTLSVHPGGSAISSSRIPEGAVVTLSEATPATVTGATWDAPSFSQNPVTIGSDAPTTVTLTNQITGDPGSVTWSKTDSDTGALLSGSVWSLTGPDGFSATIADNGSHDANPTAGDLEVDGLPWGQYTLLETTPPSGYAVSATTHTFTIGSAALTVSLGAITNSLAPVPAPSPTAVGPGAAVNTGGAAAGSTAPWLWGGLLAAGAVGIAAATIVVVRATRRHDS